MSADERVERAVRLYERAVFGGDPTVLADADRELDAAEADLALARGKLAHARFLDRRVEDPQELVFFERAAELYRALGDVRGEGEALFWVATFHQVVRRDHEGSAELLERAGRLAERAGDKLTLSYVVRHLGFVENHRGDFDAARGHFEESTRLRREVGFLPGVAANLVGLAYIAAGSGRPADVPALLAEAESIARAEEAGGILRWIDEARAELV